ncbi:MAG TPA: alpha/beta hydrolase [Steroidobacteraceae bacterium]|nr:alpha/beta hydrolase [Steroidobacteraceae bacterium]
MQNPSGCRSIETVSYGTSEHQVGDLYVPTAVHAPVICLLHGGFWRMPYGRDHIAPIALDLVERGFAVWNLEYRRVGTPGGGWPGTMQDVGAGIDHLATLAAETDAMDLSRVTVVGHSAGGHLALWSAGQPTRVRLSAAVGLAPVADLRLAYELRCGNGAVETLLGGSPDQRPLRYRTTSPAEMLPLGVKQLLIHGTCDEDVPVEISRRYARAAEAAGDDIRFIELENASHMDFVDPESEAHAILCRWLAVRA